MDETVNTSLTTVALNDSCSHPEASAHPFFMSAYGLVFLVSLGLNGFALRVYFCRARRRSSVMVYLQNLAAADFLLSLSLTLRITNYASSSATLRNIYCSFGASALYLNTYASILFMEYIAANRYLKIVRPLENNALQTVLAASYISMGTWAFLLVFAIAYVCVALLSAPKSGNTQSRRCEALHSQELAMLYRVLHAFSAGVFLIVLMSLCFFYYQITKRLKQTRQASSKKLTRARRNMLVLVSLFCVCFVPYHLVRLSYAFLKSHLARCGWGQVFYYVKEFTVVLLVLNACLDPLIYFIYCKEFRARLGIRGAQSSVTQGSSVIPGPGAPKPPHSDTSNSLGCQRDTTVI
ncbi:P2Y purinoceptor 14-like [Megalops cyprinoides]|uniref:P2Y purinoceptor 14-like n=1 Tax=Megalops cyprinoides TaxID=118141 RepID=UPI0018656AAF|nr:P2Y purinoceptor 14-like [Megalops cyprinoides]